MNHNDLIISIEANFYFYFNCKIAKILSEKVSKNGTIDFRGTFTINGRNILQRETNFTEAIDAIDNYARQELPLLIFLKNVASLEIRMADFLLSRGFRSDKPLGALQVDIQSMISIPQNFILQVDELRELRNSILHNNRLIGPKLVTAHSRAVNSTGIGATIALGDPIDLTDDCLEKTTRIIIDYSQHF